MVGCRRLPCTVVSCRRLPCRRILCRHRCHGPTLFLRRRHHHLHLSVTWRPARCSTLHRGHLLDLHRHLGTSSLFEQRQQHLRDLHRHLGDLRSYYSVWRRLKRSSTNSGTRLTSSLQYWKVGSSTGCRHRLQHHLMYHGCSFFAVSCSLEHVAFWKCVPSLAHACTDQLALQRATCKYRCVGELARAGWFFKEHLARIGSSIAVVLPRTQRLVPSLPLELSFTTRYLVIPMVVIAACTERKARVGSFAAAQVASKTSPKEEVTAIRIILPFRELRSPPARIGASCFVQHPLCSHALSV